MQSIKSPQRSLLGQKIHSMSKMIYGRWLITLIGLAMMLKLSNASGSNHASDPSVAQFKRRESSVEVVDPPEYFNVKAIDYIDYIKAFTIEQIQTRFNISLTVHEAGVFDVEIFRQLGRFGKLQRAHARFRNLRVERIPDRPNRFYQHVRFAGDFIGQPCLDFKILNDLPASLVRSLRRKTYNKIQEIFDKCASRKYDPVTKTFLRSIDKLFCGATGSSQNMERLDRLTNDANTSYEEAGRYSTIYYMYDCILLSWDEEDSTLVAIKVFSFDPSKSGKSVDRIKEEISKEQNIVDTGLALEEFPYIVNCFEVYHIEDSETEEIQETRFVFEFLDGMDLFEYVQTHRPIWEKRDKTGLNLRALWKWESTVQYLVRQMLLAVRACHDNGIIHCDLKLENFMVVMINNKLRIKLIDFGSSIKVTGYTVETPDKIYTTTEIMAPEIIEWNEKRAKGSKFITYAVDSWALGTTIFHLIFGKSPFRLVGVTETYEQVTARIKLGLADGVWRPKPRSKKDKEADSNKILQTHIVSHNVIHGRTDRAIIDGENSDDGRYIKIDLNKIDPTQMYVSQDCLSMISGLLKTDPKERMCVATHHNHSANALDQEWMLALVRVPDKSGSDLDACLSDTSTGAVYKASTGGSETSPVSTDS